MKSIIVFGATGGIGGEVVGQALEKGYRVTVVVRNPSALQLRHEHLSVIKGDVMSPGTFERAVAGHDAVVSAVGTPSRDPTTLYSGGVRNIMTAMMKSDLRRIICISASGLEINPTFPLILRLFTRHILQRLLKHPYADLRLMERELRQSGLEWTVVRPPRLRSAPRSGSYRVAVNETLAGATSISRADVAHYIVAHLFDPHIHRAVVEIAS